MSFDGNPNFGPPDPKAAAYANSDRLAQEYEIKSQKRIVWVEFWKKNDFGHDFGYTRECLCGLYENEFRSRSPLFYEDPENLSLCPNVDFKKYRKTIENSNDSRSQDQKI